MALVKVYLDPNAAAYTDDEIVGKVNAATADITRAGSVSAAARPLETGEVTETEMGAGAAKDSLDAMVDVDRGYISTNPVAGQTKLVHAQLHSDGRVEWDANDTPEA